MELDELLQGIESFSFDIEPPKYLTNKEAIEYDNTRHILCEQGIEHEWRQLQTMIPRARQVLGLYDKFVLQGYSKEKDTQCEKELAGTCIPCFIKLPEKEKYPPVIRLTWALLHVNQERSLSLNEICETAVNLPQEELDRFAYRLRRNFIHGLIRAKHNYKWHQKNPLGEMPEGLIDPEPDDDSNDCWLDLRDEKDEIWGKMRGVKLFYQTMVELIRRKS